MVLKRGKNRDEPELGEELLALELKGGKLRWYWIYTAAGLLCLLMEAGWQEEL